MVDSALFFNILAAIGGTSGIVSFARWINNRNAKVKVISSVADYGFFQDESVRELIIHTKLQIINDKDTAVCITDAIALLKTDKSKTMDKKQAAYYRRPTKFTPTKIEAGSTIEFILYTNFNSINLHPINRVALANPWGFTERGRPIFMANESDFKEKWDSLPLDMKVILHINGKELVHSNIVVFESAAESYGTLKAAEIMQLERNYLLGK